MVDRDDDLRMGAKSTAILFGDADLIAQGVLYACMLFALLLVGRQAGLGGWYWTSLAVASTLIAYEFLIARSRDRDACFRAFLHNHWVGATIFVGIALHFAMETPALTTGQITNEFLLIRSLEIEAADVGATLHLEPSDLQNVCSA